MMRASSANARAGMTAVTGSDTGLDRYAVRSATRKPSEAARTKRLPSSRARTPVRIGRVSSVAAAKITDVIMARRSSTLSWMALSRSAGGMVGNSWASMPLMLALMRPQLRLTV